MQDTKETQRTIELKPAMYVIGPVLYDQDDKLFYCRMALKARYFPLHYTVHGKTEDETLGRATALADILTKHQKL